MPRLLGVEIPADKRIEASLTYIYGIGPTIAKRILDQTNIDPNLRAKNLTPQQLTKLFIRSRPTRSRLKAICAVKCKATSNVCRRSIVIAGFGIGGACRFVASAPARTPAPAKGRAKPSGAFVTKTPKREKFNGSGKKNGGRRHQE